MVVRLLLNLLSDMMRIFRFDGQSGVENEYGVRERIIVQFIERYGAYFPFRRIKRG